MKTLQRANTRPVVGYRKIRDVPLQYMEHESTLLVNCGAAQARVIVDQWVTGRELRAHCRTEYGWRVEALEMAVTDVLGTTTVLNVEGADAVVINPTVRQVEWMRRVGAKG